MEPFLFTPFDSFLYAVDILGYSFMSLATLFAAQVFTGTGRERVARGFLLANGLLLPFLALQMYVHWLISDRGPLGRDLPRLDLDPGAPLPWGPDQRTARRRRRRRPPQRIAHICSRFLSRCSRSSWSVGRLADCL